MRQSQQHWARSQQPPAAFCRLPALLLLLLSAWLGCPAPLAAQGLNDRPVTVSGNERTRTTYIEKLAHDCLARTPPGAKAAVLAKSVRQCLLNTKLFSEVTIDAAAPTINIIVKDRWTLIPIPYLQVDTGQSRKVGVILLDSNFLGMGKLVATGASLSNQGVSFFGYYLDPSVRYTNWRSETLVDHTRENLNLYEQRTIKDSFAETTNGLLTGIGYKFGALVVNAHVGFRERLYYRVDDFAPPNEHSFSYTNFVAEYSDKDFAFYVNQGFSARLNYTQQVWRTDNMHPAGNIDLKINWESLVLQSDHAFQIQFSTGGVRGGGREDAYRLGGTRGLRGIETNSAWAERYDALGVDYQIPVHTFESGTLTTGPFNDVGVITMRGGDFKTVHYDAFGLGTYYYLKTIALPGLGLEVGYNQQFQGIFGKLTAGLSI